MRWKYKLQIKLHILESDRYKFLDSEGFANVWCHLTKHRKNEKSSEMGSDIQRARESLVAQNTVYIINYLQEQKQ